MKRIGLVGLVLFELASFVGCTIYTDKPIYEGATEGPMTVRVVAEEPDKYSATRYYRVEMVDSEGNEKANLRFGGRLQNGSEITDDSGQQYIVENHELRKYNSD